MTPFLIPHHAQALRPRQWQQAELALFAKAEGLRDHADNIIRQLEHSLGVTPFDRLSEEEKRARLLLKLAEESLSHAPSSTQDATTYTANDIRTYDKALKKLERSKTEKSDKLRDEAVATIAGVQRQAKRRADDTWLAQTHREIIALEALRQESVEVEQLVTDTEVTDDKGAKRWKNGQVVRKREQVQRLRVVTRDGLLSLAKSTTKTIDGQQVIIPATLSPEQLRTGLRYRDTYERSDPERGLRSCMGQSSARGKPDPWSADFITRQQEAATKNAELQRLDQIILARAGVKALKAIRHVCGQAKPLRALAAGSANQAYAKAMCQGLDEIASMRWERCEPCDGTGRLADAGRAPCSRCSGLGRTLSASARVRKEAA